MFCPECGQYLNKRDINPEQKDLFTNLLSESIESTAFPAIHQSAITKEEAHEKMKKYARDIQWTFAGKLRKR